MEHVWLKLSFFLEPLFHRAKRKDDFRHNGQLPARQSAKGAKALALSMALISLRSKAGSRFNSDAHMTALQWIVHS